MKNIFDNKMLLLLAALVVLLGFSGCSTHYDVLQPIPEYPAEERQYNTSATVEYVPFENADVNQSMRSMLSTTGYKDVISGVHYKGKYSKQVRIIVPLQLHYDVLNCENGRFLEVRIIVMVRQPGEINNGSLVYPTPRYFQAYSQLRLPYDELQLSDIRNGINQAVEHLFRIGEFRTALEPDSVR